MNEMFSGFEIILAYIDDVLWITKGDWSNHLEKLELTLKKLKNNELKCNTEKSLLGQIEMEYFCFLVTWTGILPINKKVEAIVNMKPPKNTKEVRAFIGIVN